MFDINHLEKRLEELRKGRARLDADLRAAEDRVAELTRALNMQDGAIASLEMLYSEALKSASAMHEASDKLKETSRPVPANLAATIDQDVLVPKHMAEATHEHAT